MPRIILLAACMLAAPAFASPFSSFSMPATCRITRIDEGGSHRFALWKGTADGTPSEYIQWNDHGSDRFVWGPPHETSDGSSFHVYETVTYDGRVSHHVYEQTLDADGRVVDDQVTHRTWTYDGDTLVGFSEDTADGFYSDDWEYADGRLASIDYQRPYGDSYGQWWEWTEDGELARSSQYGDGVYTSVKWDEWDEAGLPTHGDAIRTGDIGDAAWDDVASWDASGRPTSWNEGTTERTYDWTDRRDGASRVRSGDVAFAWDAEGRLVSTDEWAGTHRRYRWDDDGTLRDVAWTWMDEPAGAYRFDGVCPEAAWSSYVVDLSPYVVLDPLPRLPTVPRPFGW